MKSVGICSGVTICTMLAACNGPQIRTTQIEQPMAKRSPRKLETHGHVRTDDYYWLNQRSDPEVIDYLESENRHTQAVMAPTEQLQHALFEEITNRIKQDDMTAPYKLRDYYYYTRYEQGKQYPIHCRKKDTLSGSEQIMLDVNAMAAGHSFYNVGRQAVSSGQDILAYAVDTVGRRKYTIHFKNLTTGEILPEQIAEVTGNMAWAEDNRTLFYAKQHPETLRSYRIYRHTLGTDPTDDVLVYEEADEEFSTSVRKTKSRQYLLIHSRQTLSDEVRYLSATDPDGTFTVIQPRERHHEYGVDHLGGYFYVRTNDGAKNFKLMKTPVDRTEKQYWEPVVAHREDVFLEDFDLFKDHLALTERKDGLVQFHLLSWSGDEHYLDFGEAAYEAYPTDNVDIDNPLLRYSYTSLRTPDSIFDYDMNTREKSLIKEDEILGGFDKQNYITERLFATADDGVKVPISIVYRQGRVKNGASPLLLYGYGSYGFSMDASFSATRLSLIDRGFLFAIAHVRGGQELGRQWYEDGKLLNKKNTFTDFIACAEHLIDEGYTSKEHMYALGGSAGGLLMGTIFNMRPDLFNGVVAVVPFVDIVTTMLDDSIPLTTSEYDEWGNPHEKVYFDYMLSYSPYDNVERKAYTNLLVMTGLHDSQVQYWEPAKWVAKLRALRTDDSRLLLKTEMEAGHGGVTGRYKRYKETAFQYAFLLDLEGVRQ